ncbi:hypothetical protein GCM10009838_76100 [Catenulispora subtropica]|uniref:Uncharacterized protein n=1 Tax=Catenulispora subtropica TaxID=450798 RepID=A0ABN2T6H6_9ACTN
MVWDAIATDAPVALAFAAAAGASEEMAATAAASVSFPDGAAAGAVFGSRCVDGFDGALGDGLGPAGGSAAAAIPQDAATAAAVTAATTALRSACRFARPAPPPCIRGFICKVPCAFRVFTEARPRVGHSTWIKTLSRGRIDHRAKLRRKRRKAAN